jgi:hypothetical protein
VPNFNGEDVDYIDFLGIDNILNSPHDDYGEFYAKRKIICSLGNQWLTHS